jgi:hypothetical protein
MADTARSGGLLAIVEQGSGGSKRKERSNRLYSGAGVGKNAADEGKGFISGEEPFAYHPKMGRYADLHNHLLGRLHESQL